MCLYPRLIKNRKYIPNKKNKGIVPEIKDPRTLWVPVGCQKCIECKNQKGRQWSIRLQEEIRTNKTGQFVTLTFSNEAIKNLSGEIESLEGYQLDNEIATLATRRFLERWRKKYKVSVKHWLTTELGHNGTENVHLHGIIFTKEKQAIKDIWQYGYVHVGDYVNEETINYIIKYTTKVDFIHKEYNAKILTSPGIGNEYTKRKDSKLNQYNNKTGQTKETYTTRQGKTIGLPIYYRNKIYNDDEREKLWLEKLDKQERWVCGVKIDMKKPEGTEKYYKTLETYRRKNRRLGYGNNEKDWSRLQYENDRRRANMKKRLSKWEEIEEELPENINNILDKFKKI